jgi:hypothetical protein
VVDDWKREKLEPLVIRRTLSALEKKRKRSFDEVFIRSVVNGVDDAALSEAWAAGVRALRKAGRQYSTGDKAFRETLAMFQEPRLLGALQAATVADDAPLVVLAALAKDGSAESYDALMAEYERARAGKSDWGLRYKLNRLERYATHNEHWEAFSAAVSEQLQRREEKSAAHGCARRLGLRVPALELRVFLSTHGRGYVWITISDKRGRFEVQCEPATPRPPDDVRELAAWLTAFTRKHRLSFDWEAADPTCSLRGREREALLSWLRGERETPTP